jgi:hypothetical protein
MEILRLTGKPRMAIINCKEDDKDHLPAWKAEFRKNFNSNRTFNAHRATYAERILLLETLKSIDQDWQQVLSQVVTAFKKDWEARNNTTADIITSLLTEALTLQLTKNISSEEQEDKCREKLFVSYSEKISRMEKDAHQRIRNLFKHNIFRYDLPPHSILNKDLFDERTWQLLGLTRQQVVIAGGLGGAAIGAGVEMATFGHGLGIFTAMGTIAGALGALFGGENFSGKARLLGIPLGGNKVQVGPARSIDFLFILLNRSLLYYQHTINWAHGRRDYESQDHSLVQYQSPQGFTKNWSAGNIKICHDFFKAIRNEKGENGKTVEKFRQLLLLTMQQISESDVV